MYSEVNIEENIFQSGSNVEVGLHPPPPQQKETKSMEKYLKTSFQVGIDLHQVKKKRKLKIHKTTSIWHGKDKKTTLDLLHIKQI